MRGLFEGLNLAHTHNIVHGYLNLGIFYIIRKYII